MEKNETIDDWREDVTGASAVLKIKDGESVVGTFQDEGQKKTHADYGTSIAFAFLVNGEKEAKTFYVKAENYSLLSQIKELGRLTGLKVKISRTGSRRSDTRYKIERV